MEAAGKTEKGAMTFGSLFAELMVNLESAGCALLTVLS